MTRVLAAPRGGQQLHRGVELVVGGHDRPHLAGAHRLRLRRRVVHLAHVRRLVAAVRLRDTGARVHGGGGVLRLRDGPLGRGAVGRDVDPVRSLRGLVQEERRGACCRLGEVLAAADAQRRGVVAGQGARHPVDPARDVVVAAPDHRRVVEAGGSLGLGPGGEELAGDVRRVARALEVAGQRVLRRELRAGLLVEHAVVVGIATGHHRGAGRAAGRVVDEGLGVAPPGAHPLAGLGHVLQRVDAAGEGVAQVVEVVDEHVRPGQRGGGAGRWWGSLGDRGGGTGRAEHGERQQGRHHHGSHAAGSAHGASPPGCVHCRVSRRRDRTGIRETPYCGPVAASARPARIVGKGVARTGFVLPPR